MRSVDLTSDGDVRAESDLRKRIAELLLQARERRDIPQATLAAKAGVSPARLCDYEQGRRTPSLRMLVRILGALDRQLIVSLERLDARDPAAEDLRVLSVAERAAQSLSGDLLYRLDDFPYVVDGLFAALMHAVPVTAAALEIAVADVDALAAWLERIGAKRFSAHWDAWVGDSDPRAPGPLLWRAREGRIVAHVVNELPPAVPMQVGDQTVPVRALWDLELEDLEAAAALRRARRASRGLGGETRRKPRAASPP